MALSCDCGWGDYDWFYEVEETPRYANTVFRCYGCGEHNKPIGELVRVVTSYETDEDGDPCNETTLGRLCEKCSDLYDSLNELGFCLAADMGFIATAMDEYLNEYAPRKIEDV